MSSRGHESNLWGDANFNSYHATNIFICLCFTDSSTPLWTYLWIYVHSLQWQNCFLKLKPEHAFNFPLNADSNLCVFFCVCSQPLHTCPAKTEICRAQRIGKKEGGSDKEVFWFKSLPPKCRTGRVLCCWPLSLHTTHCFSSHPCHLLTTPNRAPILQKQLLSILTIR